MVSGADDSLSPLPPPPHETPVEQNKECRLCFVFVFLRGASPPPPPQRLALARVFPVADASERRAAADAM